MSQVIKKTPALGGSFFVSLPNRTEAIQGARYRVCPWSDTKKPGAPVVGYGLEEKAPWSRRYRPIGWKGKYIPWQTLAEARQAVAEINKGSAPTAAVGGQQG